MSTPTRLISLDVLRGMTISLMIMVNTPGSWAYVYSPLRHAKWHGCTPTDLVFPFFLFIVGVSIWYSFKKYDTEISKTTLLKILKRSSIIFLLGLFLNLYLYFNFGEVRVMGVLQRIAIAYGLGALICLYFKRFHILIILVLLLVGYWGLLYFGGEGDVYSLSSNFARKFDLFVLGEQHMSKGFGIPFEPEGLLSTIPAIGTVIIGFQTGKIINNQITTLGKIKMLIMLGSALVVLGLIWGTVFPINKPLWTSSYVLYTGGLGVLFLATLIWIIDFKKYVKWAMPFIHFGMNPLFIFVFSGLYVRTIIYLIQPVGPEGVKISAYKYLFQEVFSPIAGNMNGSLLFAITHIIAFWLLCFLLYKNKIYIKI